MKEVTLFTGTTKTPHISLNSGIGDASELATRGIKARVHLSAVGKYLAVHPMLSISYFVNSTDIFDDILRNITLRDEIRSNGERRQGNDLSSRNMHFRLPDKATIHADPDTFRKRFRLVSV